MLEGFCTRRYNKADRIGRTGGKNRVVILMKKTEKARFALHSLTVYRSVLQAGPPRLLQNLLQTLTTPFDAAHFLDAYGALYAALLQSGGSLRGALEDAFLNDDNGFTRGRPGAGNAAEHDLGALRLFACLSSADVKAEALALCPPGGQAREIIQTLPEWSAAACSHPAFTAENTRQLCEQLALYHRQNGFGMFAQAGAFFWRAESGAARLCPVKHPDSITMEQLRGYDDERRVVYENTAAFVEGRAANNLLLYGDRGTGKSSTVKAVFNALYGRGLRIIELEKESLPFFPALCALIEGVPLRFLLFIDDLSFRGDDDSFAALKAVLEGSLAARPENAVIYATSNRRHLVKETFSERDGDDVHAADAMQEKLSLADRFGITVTFSAPSQPLYLKIVRELAAMRGLRPDPAALERGALQWALRYNGRSPRTARQYVDWLETRPDTLP